MSRTFGRLTRCVGFLVLVLGNFPVYGYWGHTDPIVSAEDVQKAWNYETWNWMREIPRETVLGDITLVSSHDAGINEDLNEDRETDFVIKPASSTQYHSLYEQMCFGARYFDVRVSFCIGVSDLEYRALHGITFGHTLKEMMDDAVRFVTEYSSETVILKFSHWQNDTERSEVMEQILQTAKWTSKLYRSSARPAPLLNQVPLSELRGKIILLLDWGDGTGDEPEDCYQHDASVEIGCTPENGIWRFGEQAAGTLGKYGYYRVHDDYADKSSYSEMRSNQYGKWRNFVKNHNSHTNAFMLCWQLTGCADIHAGAKDINPRLYSDLNHFMELLAEYPRLVNLDFIDCNVCKAVINVNDQLIHPQPQSPVTYLEPQFGGRGEVTGYTSNVLTNYSILNGTFDWTVELLDRWYVVSANGCSLNKGADVAENCRARIILRDGTRLWSFHEDWDNGPSIDVEKTGAALTVYGQSTSTNVMGVLEVQGDTYGAGSAPATTTTASASRLMAAR